MEEFQSRKPSPPAYPVSHNLAHHPYNDLPEEDAPLEDEGNVVPMSSKSRGGKAAPAPLEAIADESLTPRSPAKRKQPSSKGRTTSKPKSAKAYGTARSAKAQPFADELQHLEQLAERINQVLEDRARRKAYLEQMQSMQSQAMPGLPIDPRYAPPAPRSPMPREMSQAADGQPNLEALDTESLKQQARRIRHQLSQLEVRMNEEMEAEDDPIDFSDAYRQVNLDADYRDRFYPPPQSPSPQPSHPPYPPTPQPSNPSNPIRQRAEYEQWRAAEELRAFHQQEQWTYPETDPHPRSPRSGGFDPVLRQVFARFRRFSVGTMLEVPRRPMEWLNDAAMWLVLSAIAQIVTRYLAVALPFLSPFLTILMFAPAALAVCLVIFMPKVGLLPVYRLFLITIGFIIGSKLF